MPSSKKRKAIKPASRASKVLLLPMPRRESEAMTLQSRIAFEAIRSQCATSAQVTTVAQAVLLTSFMTEAGHGLLDLAFIKQVEREVLALLDHGKETGEWNASATLLTSLPDVINEHDRQLREVRMGVVRDAAERLDRMVDAAIRHQDETGN